MDGASGVTERPNQVQAPDEAHWPAVWALGIGVASLSAAEMMPMSLLTLISAGLGISEGLAGQAVTAAAVVALITSLVVAPAVAGVDRRRVLLALSLLQVLSNLAVAAAPNFAAVILARLLLGVAVGGFWALSASLALRLVPRHEVPRALSIIFGGGAMAGIVAAPVGSYLGGFLGWRGVFLAAAGLAAIALTTQFLTLPSMPSDGGTRLAHLAHVLRMPNIARGLLGVVLMFGGSQTLATYLRPFLETVSSADTTQVSLALLVLGLSNFAGTTRAAALLRRDLGRTLTLVATVMAFDTAALYAFGASYLAVLLLIVVWGVARGIIPVGWSTWLTRSIPERAESGGGLLVAVIQIAVMAGAAIGGAITDGFGIHATVIASGVLLTAGALHVRFGLRH